MYSQKTTAPHVHNVTYNAPGMRQVVFLHNKLKKRIAY